MTRWYSRALSVLFLAVAVAAVLVPFFALVSAALQPNGTVTPTLSWPANPQWINFVTAWTTAGFAPLLASSALVAVVAVPICLVCSTLAGYAMATMRMPGKGILFAFFIAGLTLPYEAIVIPLYFDFRSIGLLDTYWAVILPLAGAFIPFGIFWMRGHFQSMPIELIEAAQIDGASRLRILFSVMLPSARPALTTLGLLDFMWAWNQFILALILIRNPAMRTAPSGLGAFIQQHGTDIPLLSAGTIIVIAPVVILYFFFQRQFITGLVQGALK